MAPKNHRVRAARVGTEEGAGVQAIVVVVAVVAAAAAVAVTMWLR